MEQARLNIGRLASATGTKVVTVRYYEKIGLLPAPARTAAGYRVYAAAHLDRLRFIRRARDLGFTLEEVRALLALAARREDECAGVDRIAAQHLADVEAKIADLERLAGELRRLIRCCEGGRIAECRIIEALSPDEPAVAR